jgi:hypothetical protein
MIVLVVVCVLCAVTHAALSIVYDSFHRTPNRTFAWPVDCLETVPNEVELSKMSLHSITRR